MKAKLFIDKNKKEFVSEEGIILAYSEDEIPLKKFIEDVSVLAENVYESKFEFKKVTSSDYKKFSTEKLDNLLYASSGYLEAEIIANILIERELENKVKKTYDIVFSNDFGEDSLMVEYSLAECLKFIKKNNNDHPQHSFFNSYSGGIVEIYCIEDQRNVYFEDIRVNRDVLEVNQY